MFDDSALRLRIYEDIVRTSEIPKVAKLAADFEVAVEDIRAALRRMHDAHILQPSGEALMANAFSAVPTPFVTEVGDRRWFRNCVWDALGILGTLHAEGRAVTSCACCGDAMVLTVRDGDLAIGAGIVHFAVPARRWCDDIVFN